MLYQPPHILLRTANTWGGGLDMLVLSDGDSITAFTGTGEQDYLHVLAGLLRTNRGIRSRAIQHGVNSISFNYDPGGGTMIANAAAQVDVNLIPGFSQNWLIVFAGTNGVHPSLGNHSGATEYADFKTYVAARISAGWTANKIVAVAMLPRTTIDESRRTAFNSALVGDGGGYGYRVARMDLNSAMGDAGDDLNATYYSDGTHPTAAGHAVIAQVIYDTMFP